MKSKITTERLKELIAKAFCFSAHDESYRIEIEEDSSLPYITVGGTTILISLTQPRVVSLNCIQNLDKLLKEEVKRLGTNSDEQATPTE